MNLEKLLRRRLKILDDLDIGGFRAQLMEQGRQQNSGVIITEVEKASDETLLLAIHKARVQTKDVNRTRRLASRRWLRKNGYEIPRGAVDGC